MENGLNLQNIIDHEHQMAFDQGKKKWRNILSRLLNVIAFLARQNLPLNGRREGVSSDKRERKTAKRTYARIELAIAYTKRNYFR